MYATILTGYTEYIQNLSETSQHGYLYDIACFLEWLNTGTISEHKPDEPPRHLKELASEKPLSRVNTADIRRFIALLPKLRRNVYKNTTRKTHYQKRMVSSLRKFFLYLLESQVIEKNPCITILPKEYSPIQSNTSIPPIQNVLEICETPVQVRDNDNKSIRDKTLFIFLLGSGFRISEALSLKVKDIPPTPDQAIKVTRKSGKTTETHIDPYAYRSLQSYIEVLRPPDGDYPLFPRITRHSRFIGRKPIARQSAHEILKHYMKLAGLNFDFTLHRFRNSFATDLRRSGISLENIMFLMGHSTTRETERYIDKAKVQVKPVIPHIDGLSNT